MIRAGSKIRFAAAILFAYFFLFCPLPAAAQSSAPRGKEVVTPVAYSSLSVVPRGRAFQLAVVLKIRPGFHINAREVSDSYLIATDLKAALPPGFQAGAAVYPRGTLRKFSFSPDKPLNVYQESVVIRLPLTALPGAPLGDQHIPLKLRYQACNDEICLPPVTLDLEAIVTVAPAGSKAKPAHPELFPK